MAAAGVDDPTVGLYSPTDCARSPSLNQALYDGVTDIVLGRRPLSDYDQLVADWRSGGGEQIRAEYAQALQQARR
jgi:putative aldouronate transport system substrate-binding protein